jgi:hypothetical protein
MLPLINKKGENTTLANLFSEEEILEIDGKFVVVEKEGVRYVRLFFHLTMHSRIAAHLCEGLGYAFVAAGKYARMPGKFVRYDSETCCNKYGRDCPKNEREADNLLRELETLLLPE